MEYMEFKGKNNLINNELLDTILAFNNITKLSLINDSHFPYFYKDYLHFIELVDRNKKIAVIGDYDCDGICATSIMMQFLRKLNKECTYIIGNRVIDGYGMNKRLIDIAHDFNASLIITVDNGINCFDEVEYAHNLGIEVLVTDHHLPQDKIPNCFIFNPHLENIEFKTVCGAFVSLSLVLNYFNYHKISDKDFMNSLYELAALATISDVMPLYDINRKIVAKLVSNVKNNCVYNNALKELIKELKIKDSCSNIAFYLVPVINAVGRIDDASIVVDYIINSQDEELLKEIIKCNETRKSLTAEGFSLIKYENTNINVCLIEDIHEGILGILASKLANKTHKPSFVFTYANNQIKGSGRSIPDFDLFTSVLNTKANYSSFGGHKEAIGLSFDDMTDFLAFKKEIQNCCIPNVINYYLKYEYASFKETYEVLEVLEPIGEGLRIPPFYIEGEIINIRYLANKHTSFQIKGYKEAFIYFNALLEQGRYSILFTINKEIYNNNINYKGFVNNIMKLQE